MIHRESFRASVLHLSEIQAVLQSIAAKKSVLTTPSLLSSGTRSLRTILRRGLAGKGLGAGLGEFEADEPVAGGAVAVHFGGGEFPAAGSLQR